MYICIGSGDSERYDRLLRYLARLDFLVHFNLVKAGASVTGYSETVRLWCIRAEIGGLSGYKCGNLHYEKAAAK